MQLQQQSSTQTTPSGQQPWLSVVIPTYSRAETLSSHIAAVHGCLSNDFANRRFEIIVVNDASPDQTHAVLAELGARFPAVRILNLEQNLGQQAATRAGLALAVGSVVVTLDDDGKDDPADIVRLVDLLSAGHDVVYGIPGQETTLAWYRRLGTVIKEALLGCLCHKPKSIRLTGFRAMNRATVDRIVADTRRHLYISATILEKPVRIGQVQVAAPVRNASGYSLTALARLLLRIALWYGPFYRLLIRMSDSSAIHHPIQVHPETQT